MHWAANYLSSNTKYIAFQNNKNKYDCNIQFIFKQQKSIAHDIDLTLQLKIYKLIVFIINFESLKWKHLQTNTKK